MAEAVFRDIIKKRKIESKWTVDSAALIDYHVGKRFTSGMFIHF